MSNHTKIAINAISASSGGGRTYLQRLVAALSEQCPNVTLDVLLAGTDRADAWPKCERITYIDTRTKNIVQRLFYEKFHLQKLSKSNNWRWLLSPNGSAPRLVYGTRIVSVMQNQLVWDLPLMQEFGWSRQYLRLMLLRWASLRALHSADRILYVSNTIKKSAESAAHQDTSAKSAVIYLGLETVEPQSAAHLLPEDASFFFYPSPFFPYKRQHILLEAFEMFCVKNPQDRTVLVLAGAPGWGPYHRKILKIIRQSEFKSRILTLGPQPRGIIEDLYRRARVVIFPSVCESISLIVLEALSSGARLICANTSVMPEVAKNYAEYFEADNSKHLLSLMESQRDQISQQRKPDLSEFSWANHVKRFMALLNREN